MINFDSFLLGLHLLGAGVSLVLVTGALVSLAQARAHQYLFWSRSIGLASIFQIVTGLGLVISLFQHTSVLAACVRLGLYIVVMSAVEGVLLYRLKQRVSVSTK